MIEKMQKLQNISKETIEYFQGNFNLEKEKVSSIINKFFAMSSKLKKGAEQTGSIGVLIIVLAMANPCSANPAAGIAFAEQFYAYYQTIVAPIIMEEVARQMIIRQQTFQVVNLMAHLGASAKPAVGKVVSNAVQAEVQTGAKVVVATGKALATEIAIHGVMTSLNVGLAIWDIVSLVKTWNSVHPAVEVIDKVLINLTQIEQSIQTQMEVMVDTNVEPLVTTRAETMVKTSVKTSVKSGVKKTKLNTEDSEDSDEEEEDKVRIYDKTTDKMKVVLQSSGVSGFSKPQDHYNRSVSELVSLIQMVLETTGNRNHRHQHSTSIQHVFQKLMGQDSTFTKDSYFLMIDCIHVLIALHGAIFKKSQEPSVIVLEIPKVSVTITFDSHDRDYFRDLLLPIYAIMKIPLKEDKRCCIYRFHCIKCEQEMKEFNYVGQSRNFPARYKTHTHKMLTTWMDHEDRMNAYQAGTPVPRHVDNRPLSVLYEHPHHSHFMSKDKFSDIYEVDIVCNLEGNNTASKTDSLVRRSWEVYYQWLFKARATEGGGSRR